MISPDSSVGKGYQYFWPSRIACLSTGLEQFLEAVFFVDYFFHHTKIYFSN